MIPLRRWRGLISRVRGTPDMRQLRTGRTGPDLYRVRRRMGLSPARRSHITPRRRGALPWPIPTRML